MCDLRLSDLALQASWNCKRVPSLPQERATESRDVSRFALEDVVMFARLWKFDDTQAFTILVQRKPQAYLVDVGVQAQIAWPEVFPPAPLCH